MDWKEYVNRKDIFKALETLVSTNLKFNILKKDNTVKDWNVVTLLGEVSYKDPDGRSREYIELV